MVGELSVPLEGLDSQGLAPPVFPGALLPRMGDLGPPDVNGDESKALARSGDVEPYVNPTIPNASVFVRTISDETRIRAIELRIAGLTFKQVSRECGISQDSALRFWRQYQKSRFSDRRKNVDAEFESLLQKMERAADEAWASYERASEKGAMHSAERFLTTHTRTLEKLVQYGPQYQDSAAQAARVAIAEQAVSLAGVVRDAITDSGLDPEAEQRLLAAIAVRMRRFDEPERDAVWDAVDSEVVGNV